MPDAAKPTPNPKMPGLSGEDRRWLVDRFNKLQDENRAITIKSIHLAFLAGVCIIVGIFDGLVARQIFNRISAAAASIGDAQIGLLTHLACWVFAVLAVINIGVGLVPPMPSRLTLWMWLRTVPLALSAVVIVLAAKWYLKK